MSRSRQILAVVAVTTALCADRVVSAAPISRAPITDMAARLVTRLSQSFQRTVPGEFREAVRHHPTNDRTPAAQTPSPQAVKIHCGLSPFQFRLPPPVV